MFKYKKLLRLNSLGWIGVCTGKCKPLSWLEVLGTLERRHEIASDLLRLAVDWREFTLLGDGIDLPVQAADGILESFHVRQGDSNTDRVFAAHEHCAHAPDRVFGFVGHGNAILALAEHCHATASIDPIADLGNHLQLTGATLGLLTEFQHGQEGILGRVVVVLAVRRHGFGQVTLDVFVGHEFELLAQFGDDRFDSVGVVIQETDDFLGVDPEHQELVPVAVVWHRIAAGAVDGDHEFLIRTGAVSTDAVLDVGAPEGDLVVVVVAVVPGRSLRTDWCGVSFGSIG